MHNFKGVHRGYVEKAHYILSQWALEQLVIHEPSDFKLANAEPNGLLTFLSPTLNHFILVEYKG